MKKILSMVLACLLAFSVIPGSINLTASAATSGTTGSCTWTLDGTELTISGNGKMEDYIYSDKTPWGTNITKVIIENGVTSIGSYAFRDCTGLTSVTIPNSVTSIGYYAFESCDGLTSITIPDSVTSIGIYAFEDCSGLTNVTIGNSVTTIADFAFEGCTRLTSITIPNSVTFIGWRAFYYCTALTSVTIGNSVTSIGACAFEDCTRLTSITIPDSVTSIGGSAFEDCSGLTNVTIGNSVTTIGYSAFRGCTGLTSITIPNSVTFIDYYAFRGCTGLTSIKIPYKVSKIDAGILGLCENLKNVYIYNKNCSFNDSCGLNYNNTIYGFNGSTAEKFADKIGAEFIDIMTVHSHTYDNVCDEDCNECGVPRKITHTYQTTVNKATTSKDGRVVKKCTKCGDISTTTIKYAKIFKLSTTSYTYDGKAKKPSVKVYDSAGKTISSSNYTVTYATGRKNVGVYKVTIKFKGTYSGSKTLTFKINPKKTSVSKLTAAKKSLKISVKKQSGITGYEVQYSTSKKFSGAKTKAIKTTSVTLKSLKAKKTYYVRVRTYKTVKGKKYYSGWSTYKSKKTK